MIVRIADLMAAEKRLDEAVAALEEYRSNSDAHPAFESLTKEGRKELNVFPVHFETIERLRNKVAAAERDLVGLQSQWGAR